MTNPYLRAAQRHAHIRQQALERLNQRPVRHEWVDDNPRARPPAPPGRPETIDVAVIERARDEHGKFRADDPTTPAIDEAWVEIMPDDPPKPARGRRER